MTMTSKITKYIITTSLLSLVLMLPNTALLVSASSLMPERVHPEIPDHAKPLQKTIDEQTDLHPDWIGIISWDEKNAKIEYLGPGKDNPFRMDQAQWTHSPPTINSTKVEKFTVRIGGPTGGDVSTLTTTYKVINVFDSIYWREFGGGNTIYKIEQSFPLVASTTTGVNLYHWLDAKNSNTQWWLQSGVVYDKANLWDTTSKWYGIYDLWSTSTCTEDSSFPIRNPISFTTGNTATSYIRADTAVAGKYVMGITSGSLGTSVTLTVSGDSGHNIDVGRTTNCGKVFPSGTQVEEDSLNTGTRYYYGTIDYTYGFYETSTSAKETSVYDYFGKEGTGGSITEFGSPAKLRFSCTGALTCP